ncbi:MAG: hypothetical protein LQ349_002048 [Xanthoria aureola]|nr:MAG: hypothetical protein LQ349_002048 [Xanthoria aureola]
MAVAPTDSHGTTVNVVTWFLLAVTLITVILRTATKWFVTLNPKYDDDAAIILASVFAVGQSIAIAFGVSNGLGQHAVHLTASQALGFQKSYYAAVLLYVPCVCLSKLAVLLLLRNITPNKSHQRMASTTAFCTLVWTGVAEVVLAFQCKVPDTWAVMKGECINLAAVWYWYGITQLLLDGVVVVLPWIIVRRVQMTMQRKVVITCCFATRLTIIVAVIAQLAYFNSAISSKDVTYQLWSEIVCTQVTQSLGIITACVPYLRPFLQNLQSGMVRRDDFRGTRRTGYTPTLSRARHSPAVLSLGVATMPEVIGLDSSAKVVPSHPVRDDGSKTTRPAILMQHPQVVTRPSCHSPLREASITTKHTDPSQGVDGDQQSSRAEIMPGKDLSKRPMVTQSISPQHDSAPGCTGDSS